MPEPFTHPSPSPESAAAAAPQTGENTLATDWTRTVVAFVDVVESVRLMQVDEAGTIRRWRRFVAEVVEHILPATGGRLVKSLGDGMLLEFGSVPQAVAAAHAMHRRIRASDLPDSPDTALWLRVGVHVTQVVRDSLDLFGAGVNLGARIAAAAQPGAVLVSAEARAQLLPGLDGEIEDAGECYLKHIDGTHRLFRVSPPGPATVWRPTGARTSLRPTIGVAPMQV
ncbi:MAG: adenylate/guanylate cyclase domain-containing protein, partial [Rubrivivax sp.]|nr:adenylate/guanylate cyclase domain-containing protein [Rubrivivax sp.]